MTRFALQVSYDGSRYHGWQFQDNIPTVQHQLELALSKVAKTRIQVICAGRTDAGVHATAQIIHFDTNVTRQLKAWVMGTNTYLPPDIAVHWAKEVSDDFHARFSAIKRRYVYIIYNKPHRPSLFYRNMTWHYRPLNEECMAQAGQLLLGEHDFSSFRGADCQANTPYRNVLSLDVYRQQHLIIVDITANSFLHHMVRNIVGVLIKIGEGKKPAEWARAVLDAKSRQAASNTAPANGLFLTKVYYPLEFKLPNGDINLQNTVLNYLT